ncbi:MAG: hypothetical protein HGA44_21075 [Cellulomonadaceae bacterium]|nr:hypothetical protein [Cellulomonadaceae bacterium]
MSESPVLADLCIDYAKRLEAANNDEHRLSAYGFATVGGVAPLTPAVRTVYRGSVLGELPFEGAPTLPHSRPESFARWLHRPVRPTPWTTLTPAEYAHWLATPDLQAAAPHPLSHSAHELRRRISMLHAETLDAVDRVVRVDEGWTVLAGGSAEPTSEARLVAQRVADALRRGPLPVDLLDPHRVGQGRDVRWAGADEVAGERILGNLVMCIDPRRVILAELALQLEGCPGLRIGVWLGSDDLDLVWQAESINAFDEIWTLSATQGERIADGSEVRVRRLAMPLPEAIAPPRPVGSSAAQVVAFELDPRVPASAQRLDVALEAYRRAVPAGTGHRIEVRTGHTALARADLELVHHLAMARPDIHVVDDEAGSSRPVDVLLAINPAAATGLAAQAALARGSLVVTSEPGPGILSGRDVGVVRARLDGSHEEQVAALAEALASALDGGPAPSAAHDVEVTGSDVLALATAALREGRRPRRGVASHGSGLEAEVRRLRQESAHLRAELTALEGTKVFRYTRAARSAYGALLASFRSRARH